MLVDTDVMIWHLRGLPKATQRLDSLPQLTLSAVTWLELLQGFRNQAELLAVQTSLTKRHAQQLSLTPTITATAIKLMETLALSHGLRLADALIAATAIEHNLPLLTGNYKHFAAIENLSVERFDP